MFRLFFIIFYIVSFVNANDVLKYKNVLSVKNIIAKEDAIAKEFERYILNELKIPTLSDLSVNKYLGENFSLTSNLGNDISFNDINNLKLNLSIPSTEDSYIKDLYVRELYRTNTIVDWANGVVKIILKSDEAKNIFSILKGGDDILSSCSETLINKYCQSSELHIRYYNSDSKWIEYNKSSFENGPVAVSSSLDVANETKLNALPVGAKVYNEDGGIKIKIADGVYKDIDL